jgi:hypothetical protein
MSGTVLSIPTVFGGALLALGWLIPNHYFPWVSFYGDFVAGLGLLLLAAHAVWIHRGTSLRLPLPAGLLVAVALLPLLQAVTGQIYFAGDGWIAALYVAGLATAYVTGFLLARRSASDTAEFLAWLFLLGALASAFLAFVQSFRIEGLGI